MKDFFVARAYFFGWSIVRRISEKSAKALFSNLGAWMYGRNGKSVDRLRSNLSRVFPKLAPKDLEVLVRRGVLSYMRYWMETFRSPDWDRERILSTVTVSNEHLLLDPIKNHTGVVVSLPHAGNWDHAGSYFCIRGAQLVTVAEVLKPRALFEKFLAYRQAIGMEVLPLDSRAFPTLMQRARDGKLIALVADRDLSSSGIDVQFFGGVARMPAGPAIVAIRTGIPLVTAFVSYTETGIHVDLKEIAIPDGVDEAARVKATVQLCADNFAEGIKAFPHDWHMMQRIWVDGDFVERS
jgi:phosphatidylinositol dimannoside acyltransferase